MGLYSLNFLRRTHVEYKWFFRRFLGNGIRRSRIWLALDRFFSNNSKSQSRHNSRQIKNLILILFSTNFKHCLRPEWIIKKLIKSKIVAGPLICSIKTFIKALLHNERKQAFSNNKKCFPSVLFFFLLFHPNFCNVARNKIKRYKYVLNLEYSNLNGWRNFWGKGDVIY